jgi:hypothetical protein
MEIRQGAIECLIDLTVHRSYFMPTEASSIEVVDQWGLPDVVWSLTLMIRSGTFSNPEAMEEGPVGYQLSDGTVLNIIDGGFEIPGSERRFKRSK